LAITTYPNKYPNTICIYENWLDPTHPGTEINETPDNEAPIIPKATMYQGDFLFPRKKAAFPAFFPVKKEIINRVEK
jgi:hypothetical protein